MKTLIPLAAAALGAQLLGACSGGGKTDTVAGPPPALPTGRLQMVSTGVSDTRYLALDDLQKNGAMVGATVLQVGRTDASLPNKAALVVKREVIDCQGRRVGKEMAAYYDAYGKMLTSELLTGGAGRPAASGDTELEAACSTAKGAVLTGYGAAQREMQTPPADLAARAAANPKDGETWAWFCAGAAHGKGRPAGGADPCDTAVALQPQNAALRIDRGYVRLMRQDLRGAETDFQAALAAEPQNSRALFGRSLRLAMAGDTAASRALRGQALDLDPEVPTWVTDTYGIHISDAYARR